MSKTDSSASTEQSYYECPPCGYAGHADFAIGLCPRCGESLQATLH